MKIFLQKVTSQIGSEELFLIKNVQNTLPWTYFIICLNREKISGTYCEKEFQKINQKEFRVKMKK